MQMVKITISYETENEKDRMISALSSKETIKKIVGPYKKDKYNNVYVYIK
ncbi:hypothetical protein [Clostridium saccharoperbutylacetonicum]